MPNSAIYLNPSAGTPAVIEVGGTCYMLSGPSSNAPDTSAFDSEATDCTGCPALCVGFENSYTLTTAYLGVTYTCELTQNPSVPCRWEGGFTLAGSDSAEDFVLVPAGPGGDQYSAWRVQDDTRGTSSTITNPNPVGTYPGQFVFTSLTIS